ncbi:MAG: organic hydroperoxide resistance protein [Chitinophagaceae bacterium]
MEKCENGSQTASVHINESIQTAQPYKVQYTAKTNTTGGRDGMSKSSDGHFNIKRSTPGIIGTGTNPEQLFAAGWSAYFEGAMGFEGRKMKVKLPEDLAIHAEVDLCNDDGVYSLQARLNVNLPGLDYDVAHALVDTASQTCPYSKSIPGNIPVEFNLV